MGFAITNKVINFPPHFTGVGESTNFQFVSSGTTTSTSVAGPYFEFADYTTTFTQIPGSSQAGSVPGGFGDFGAPRLGYRAFVNFKAYTAGTGTSTSGSAIALGLGPIMTLEAASSTAFSPTYTLDYRVLPSPAATTINGTSTGSLNAGGPSMFMFGIVPVVGGLQFARIALYAVGTAIQQASSTQFDVIMQAV